MIDLLLQRAHLGEEGVVVGIGLGQLGGDRIEPIDHGLGLGDAVLHVLEHRLRLVELRLLEEDPDGVAVHELGLAIRHLVEAGHDLDKARLSGPVGADDADLRAGKEREGHVIEDDLVAVGLACLMKGVNELSHSGRA
ncbi:unannotated protein [freshwater metagenome]|uniref:Unannotated protein n=1 Tax=freshwater metagenome TaxID=449393 RepID=A0A6J7P7A4_9ZZZZ